MIFGDNKFTESNQGVKNILLASLEDMENFLISKEADFLGMQLHLGLTRWYPERTNILTQLVLVIDDDIWEVKKILTHQEYPLGIQLHLVLLRS